MRRHVRLAALMLGALLFMAVLMSQSLTAYAAPDCPPSAPETSCLASLSPSAVANTQSTTITVLGQGFVNAPSNPQVFLNGTIPLATTWLGATTLTAVVPAGLPGQINGQPNTVTVLNGDGITADGSLTLLILTPAPTAAPTTTATATAFIRPIVTVLSYTSSVGVLYPGMEFDINMTVQNTGALTARNVTLAFGQGDVVPRDTGGLRALGDILPGGTVAFDQPMRANSTISGYEAVIDIELRYNDEYGAPYADPSTLSFEARTYSSTATPVPTPTPTATLSVRPQIMVEDYTLDPEVLSPGTVFDLTVNLFNASEEPARQVVIALRQSDISLTSIAPLSSGNLRYFEQMAPGARTAATFQMAVSGDAEGGLVPVNLELSYIDNYNVQHTETETISLAVTAKPYLQIGLFEPLPDFIQVGDTFDLPVEVINIGAQSVNISTVEVIGDDRVELESASVYLGPLDAGTSGALIASVTALEAGSIPLEVRVHYLNSFQQPETMSTTIAVEVEEGPPAGGQNGGNGSSGSGAEEGGESGNGELTLGDRMWRAFLGFLGLGTRDPEASLDELNGGNGGIIVGPRRAPAEGQPAPDEREP